MAKLLIVDDNEKNLNRLRAVLEKHGHAVASAIHGAAALELARQIPPDLIISDILMPVMDGYNLCREWRRDPILKAIPFIFYTATYVDARDEKLAVKLGADRFIAKPVSNEELILAVRTTINKIRPIDIQPEIPEDAVCLREYNAVLIRKLENIMARQRAIMDIAENILLVLSLDRKIMEFNPAAERLFSRTKASVMGEDYRCLLAPDSNKPAIEAVLPNVLMGEVVRGVEENFVAGDGRERTLLWNVSQLTDAGGQVTGIVAHGTDITARKRAEESLRERERIFKALYNQTDQFIGLLSPEGVILSANRPSCQFSGIQESDIIGLKFWDCPWWWHSEEEQSKVRLAIHKAAKGQCARFETTHRSATGELRTFDFSINPVRNAQGHVEMLIPQGRDITERKLGEIALRESEERFWQLQEASSEAIIIHEKGYILDTNKRTSEMSGYLYKELMGMDAFQLVAPEWRSRVKAKIANLNDESVDDQSFDIEAVRKDGKKIPVEIRAKTIPFHGRNVRVAVARDLTERRRVESAIKESEEKYRTLVSNIPGVIYRCACDLNWTMHYISDAVEQVTGYRASDFVHNRRRAFKSIIHPEDQLRVKEMTLSSVHDRSPYELEYRVVHADGHLRWIHEKGQGVFSVDGELVFLDGVMLDITELKQAQAERENLIADLQKALSEVKTLGGLLPICASCKKIRDDKGYWNQIEAYIRDHSEAEFSHSICPDCAKKYYPDLLPLLAANGQDP